MSRGIRRIRELKDRPPMMGPLASLTFGRGTDMHGLQPTV